MIMGSGDEGSSISTKLLRGTYTLEIDAGGRPDDITSKGGKKLP
jgi:hypothetical protein